jgi:hypothetical protein
MKINYGIIKGRRDWRRAMFLEKENAMMRGQNTARWRGAMPPVCRAGLFQQTTKRGPPGAFDGLLPSRDGGCSESRGF